MIQEIRLQDIPGVNIGHAEDLEAKTGVTVLVFPQGASAGVEMKRFGFEPKKGDNLGQIASLGWITMGFGAQVLDPVACTIISHAVNNPLTRPTDIYASQD